MSKRYITTKTDTGWITHEIEYVGTITPDDENGPFEITKKEYDEVKGAGSIELSDIGTDVIVIPDGVN